jgi:hypothetical protein
LSSAITIISISVNTPYANSRYERIGQDSAGEAIIEYGSATTVTLEAEQDGVRYTPVGTGIEIDASNSN